MHSLHLMRHAKSSWKEDVADRERPLVLCSSAVRARETMELVLAEYRVRPRSMIEDELYAASVERLMGRLRRLDEDNRNVLLIGHNPELHELAVSLADVSSPGLRALASSKFPTAARASFRMSDRWSALGGSRYELVAYVTVESLRGDKG